MELVPGRKRLNLYISPAVHDQLRIDGVLPAPSAAVFLVSSSEQGCTNAYLYEYEAAKKGGGKLYRWISDVRSYRKLADETNTILEQWQAVENAIRQFKS